MLSFFATRPPVAVPRPNPFPAMAYLHYRTRNRIPTQIWTANLMATLYCMESGPIAETDSDSDLDLNPYHYCTYFRTDICTRIGIRVRVRQCKFLSSCFFHCFCTCQEKLVILIRLKLVTSAYLVLLDPTVIITEHQREADGQ